MKQVTILLCSMAMKLRQMLHEYTCSTSALQVWLEKVDIPVVDAVYYSVKFFKKW